MSEAEQNPIEQPPVMAAYVAPPATLPMPTVVMASPTPEPVPTPTPTPEPLSTTASERAPEPIIAPPAPPPSVLLPPPPAAPKVGTRRLVGVVAVVVVLLVGLGVGVSLGRTSNDRPDTPGTPGAAINAGATTGTQSPAIATTEPAPPPTTSAPNRPVTPEQALALTDQQALDELNLQVTEAASEVAGLVGAWVPQVSSKCVGVSVDIGPDWVPDGVDDTADVTLQQILAFHVSLHNRFNAVTLLPTQAGLPRDQATSGPCASSTTWMSAVPQRFASAADANAWCAANVPPIRECSARYFAGPGERSTMTLRH